MSYFYMTADNMACEVCEICNFMGSWNRDQFNHRRGPGHTQNILGFHGASRPCWPLRALTSRLTGLPLVYDSHFVSEVESENQLAAIGFDLPLSQLIEGAVPSLLTDCPRHDLLKELFPGSRHASSVDDGLGIGSSRPWPRIGTGVTQFNDDYPDQLRLQYGPMGYPYEELSSGLQYTAIRFARHAAAMTDIHRVATLFRAPTLSKQTLKPRVQVPHSANHCMTSANLPARVVNPSVPLAPAANQGQSRMYAQRIAASMAVPPGFHTLLASQLQALYSCEELASLRRADQLTDAEMNAIMSHLRIEVSANLTSISANVHQMIYHLICQIHQSTSRNQPSTNQDLAAVRTFANRNVCYAGQLVRRNCLLDPSRHWEPIPLPNQLKKPAAIGPGGDAPCAGFVPGSHGNCPYLGHATPSASGAIAKDPTYVPTQTFVRHEMPHREGPPRGQRAYHDGYSHQVDAQLQRAYYGNQRDGQSQRTYQDGSLSQGAQNDVAVLERTFRDDRAVMQIGYREEVTSRGNNERSHNEGHGQTDCRTEFPPRERIDGRQHDEGHVRNENLRFIVPDVPDLVVNGQNETPQSVTSNKVLSKQGNLDISTFLKVIPDKRPTHEIFENMVLHKKYHDFIPLKMRDESPLPIQANCDNVVLESADRDNTVPSTGALHDELSPQRSFGDNLVLEKVLRAVVMSSQETCRGDFTPIAYRDQLAVENSYQTEVDGSTKPSREKEAPESSPQDVTDTIHNDGKDSLLEEEAEEYDSDLERAKNQVPKDGMDGATRGRLAQQRYIEQRPPFLGYSSRTRAQNARLAAANRNNLQGLQDEARGGILKENPTDFSFLGSTAKPFEESGSKASNPLDTAFFLSLFHQPGAPEPPGHEEPSRRLFNRGRELSEDARNVKYEPAPRPLLLGGEVISSESEPPVDLQEFFMVQSVLDSKSYDHFSKFFKPSTTRGQAAQTDPGNEFLLRQGRPDPVVCSFCKKNSRTQDVYTSHRLHDPSTGHVECPYLRQYRCATCNAKGDNSHTKKYCPLYSRRRKT